MSNKCENVNEGIFHWANLVLISEVLYKSILCEFWLLRENEKWGMGNEILTKVN